MDATNTQYSHDSEMESEEETVQQLSCKECGRHFQDAVVLGQHIFQKHYFEYMRENVKSDSEETSDQDNLKVENDFNNKDHQRANMKINYQNNAANSQAYMHGAAQSDVTYNEKVVPQVEQENDDDDDDMSQCKYCLKWYLNSAMLKKHINTIHGEQLKKTEMTKNVSKKIKQNFKKQTFEQHEHRIENIEEMQHRDELVKENGRNLQQKTGPSHDRAYNGGYSTNGNRENSPSKKPYECMFCGNRYCNAVNLGRHIAIKHGQPGETKVVNKVTAEEPRPIKEDMQKVNMTEKDKPYQCKECQICFTRSYTLTMHTLYRHGDKKEIDCMPTELLHSCSVCGKSFLQKGSLNIHMRIHSGERPFQCWLCGQCFISATSLKMHKYSHTGHSPFQCIQCDKKFAFSVALKKHQLTHQPNFKPLRCTQCNKRFTNKHQLKLHIRFHKKRHRFNCLYCYTTFPNFAKLKYHVRNHQLEPPYNCKNCGIDFKDDRVGLIEHLLNYAKDQSYKCNLCDLFFPHSKALNRHDSKHHRIQELQTVYKCTQCFQMFYQKSELEAHMCGNSNTMIQQEVEDTKLHTCTECGKGFKHKGSLAKHAFVHSGIKPFSCPVCDKRFTFAHVLKKHFNVHSKTFVNQRSKMQMDVH